MLQLPTFKHSSGSTCSTPIRLMAKKWHKYANVNVIFVSDPAVSIYLQPSGKCYHANLFLSSVSDLIALVTVFYILKQSNVKSTNFLCYSFWALWVWNFSPFSSLQNVSPLTNFSSYPYFFLMCARMTIIQILAILYLSSLLNFLSHFPFFLF